MNKQVTHTPCYFIVRTMIVLLLAAIGISAIAQQNEKIHFQITVRDYNGNLLRNQELGVRIRVLTEDMDKVFEEFICFNQVQRALPPLISAPAAASPGTLMRWVNICAMRSCTSGRI
jgi:hypothetical protein